MIPREAWEALFGFGGGAIFAAGKLQTGICGGDKAPDTRAQRRAWAEFLTSVSAATLITAVGTTPLVGLAHGHAPWPAVAVGLGLSSNKIWPVFVGAVGEEMKGRLKAALDLIFNGQTKP